MYKYIQYYLGYEIFILRIIVYIYINQYIKSVSGLILICILRMCYLMKCKAEGCMLLTYSDTVSCSSSSTATNVNREN